MEALMPLFSRLPAVLCIVALLSACAHVEYSDTKPTDGNGVEFRTPVPYILIAQAADCAVTVTPTAMPGASRWASFHPGLGSAEMNMTLDRGMLTVIGQKGDSQIPQTITAISGAVANLAPLIALFREGGSQAPARVCPEYVRLYPIDGAGVPIMGSGVDLLAGTERPPAPAPRDPGGPARQ
jgi:hypothetical protein